MGYRFKAGDDAKADSEVRRATETRTSKTVVHYGANLAGRTSGRENPAIAVYTLFDELHWNRGMDYTNWTAELAANNIQSLEINWTKEQSAIPDG